MGNFRRNFKDCVLIGPKSGSDPELAYAGFMFEFQSLSRLKEQIIVSLFVACHKNVQS